MSEKGHRGYRGAALSALKNFQAWVWSDVKVTTSDGEFTGIILPRNETDDDSHIILKLSTGFNIGVNPARSPAGRSSTVTW